VAARVPAVRLSNIVLGFAFAGAVCLTVAAGAAYTALYAGDHRRLVGRELEAVAALKTAELAEWRRERLADGTAVRENPDFAAALADLAARPADPAALSRIAAWLRTVRTAYGYDRLFLFGPGGRVLAGWPADGVDDPAILAAAPEAARARTAGFLDFYRNPLDSRVYLAALIPVGPAAGGGLLALRIDPERYLYPFIARWPTASASSETLLARREGDAVVFLNALRFDADAALRLSMPLRVDSEVAVVRAALGERGGFFGRDYRGEKVLAALAAVEASPWLLVARIDIAEVDAAERDRRILVGLLTAAVLAVEFSGMLAARRRWRLAALEREAAAAAAVRLEEERLRLALTAANQGLYDLNVQTGESVVNDMYASMLGYDPATFIETNAAWIARLHPDDRAAVAREYADYIAGKIPEYRVEFRQRTADGGWKWILSLGKLVERDAAGRPLRMLGTHTDISDKKAHELELTALNADLERRVAERTAQLADSNRELETFAYSVAHDLRAPLRSIDGFARILEQDFGAGLGAEGRRLLGVIRGSDRAMDRLIGGLLDLTRVGKTDMNPGIVDMAAAAREAFNGCDEAGADFDILIGDLPAASADPTLISRVWANLLSNAVKYSGPSAMHRIEVAGEAKDGMNVYSVRDHGVGFDQRYAERLFGLFQRLHGVEEFPGSGIGLTIVKRIVERHGGAVRAEGRLGAGATFIFTLPVRERSPA
jgi:PAS domain S-box-containing protein